MNIYQKLKGIIGLSIQLAKAGFKLRNEGTWLGIFWYLLSPILTFLLLLGIFSNNLGVDIPYYPLYLLLGILLFNFFQSATSASTNIIRASSGLIKSINFPRESLIGGIILSTLFSHFFEIVILVIFLIVFDIPIIMMIFYPIILLFLFFFVLGFSFILASITVYIRDIDNIWSFASRLIWFATPIFYSVGENSKLYYANLINPMFYYITIARELIVYSKIPSLWMVLVAIGYGFLFTLIGLIVFNLLKNKFAELI